VREDAFEFGESAFGGRRECLEADLAECAQAERESESFFIGEEQWWQAEAGAQAVGAAYSGRGVDGDAEVFESDDVALYGAQVYLQALGELRTGDTVACLKDFKHCEDAHDGILHVCSVHPIYDRHCRECAVGCFCARRRIPIKGWRKSMANEAMATVLTPKELLTHWQGHRLLTRTMIEAFPDDKLFTYSLGGMRTFGELGNEFLGMALQTVRGMTTDKWEQFEFAKPTNKQDLLAEWDAQTAKLNEEVPLIPAGRFSATMKAFGQWDMKGYQLLLYVIENEVHHRGQGYVYLRSLGIEPPAFYNREM